MKLLAIGMLVGVTAIACNRGETATAAKTPEAFAPNSAAPTGTAGARETPPAPKETGRRGRAEESNGARTAVPADTPDAARRSAAATSGDVQSASAAWREVTIPAGTSLPLVLDTGVGSDISRVEQPVQAHLARAVLVHGATVLPQGSAVSGVVTQAVRSGKVKGLAHVAVRFDSISPRGADERYRIRTAAVGRTAPATKKKDAITIGAPAAGGAVIGGIIGGKKGAAIGTAVGGGGGTAAVLTTRGKEVRMGRGSVVTVRLTEPLTVRVRG
jgi:hypothetical protein